VNLVTHDAKAYRSLNVCIVFEDSLEVADNHRNFSAIFIVLIAQEDESMARK